MVAILVVSLFLYFLFFVLLVLLVLLARLVLLVLLLFFLGFLRVCFLQGNREGRPPLRERPFPDLGCKEGLELN